MKITYSRFREMPMGAGYGYDDLLKLFNHLLAQAGGDASTVFDWLLEINRRHPLFEAAGGFDNFIKRLEEEGIIRRDELSQKLKLTGFGKRGIRRHSLERIFGGLLKKAAGFHQTPYEGRGIETLSETKPYEFGESLENIDFTRTFKNSFRRGLNFSVEENDVEVFEKTHLTHTATVIMLDISHSMVLYGEDRITPAKTVAMALAELIMTKFPKDALEIVLFYDDARVISVKELPEVQAGPYHTNTCQGLRLARDILRKKKNTNKQIIMITDGKPTVVYHKGRMYKNSWGEDPIIINRTLDEAKQCKRQNIIITTFMIAQDPWLVRFVETMTQINGGRAYYSDLQNLGNFVLSDYVKNRKKRVR